MPKNKEEVRRAGSTAPDYARRSMDSRDRQSALHRHLLSLARPPAWRVDGTLRAHCARRAALFGIVVRASARRAQCSLFFVISGFILGLPFARQWLLGGRVVSLGKYFLRRLTRLEPPYIASYVVAALLLGIYTHGAGITRLYLEHIAAGVVYLKDIIFRASNPVNPVTWSLEIEIQFCITAPVFALLFRIRNAVFRRWLKVFCIALENRFTIPRL